jgi:hypothetical protein
VRREKGFRRWPVGGLASSAMIAWSSRSWAVVERSAGDGENKSCWLGNKSCSRVGETRLQDRERKNTKAALPKQTTHHIHQSNQPLPHTTYTASTSQLDPRETLRHAASLQDRGPRLRRQCPARNPCPTTACQANDWFPPLSYRLTCCGVCIAYACHSIGEPGVFPYESQIANLEW